MVQSPVPMAMELDVTLDKSLLATSVRQRLLAVNGADVNNGEFAGWGAGGVDGGLGEGSGVG